MSPEKVEKAKLNGVQKELNDLKSKYGQLAKNKGKGNDGAKGDSKGGKKGRKQRDAPRPRALLGMDIVTDKGESLCFAYNLGGCDRAKDGEKCDKGHHLCARTGCLKAHGQRQHA